MPSSIRIIGVPMDLGQSRRGVDMGPSAVRYTDLRERLEKLGHTVEDVGNVHVPFREDAAKGAQRGAKFLGAITEVCVEVAALSASCSHGAEARQAPSGTNGRSRARRRATRWLLLDDRPSALCEGCRRQLDEAA